ncbi:Lrp/AsnC family transcriptional regulator [Aestuariivirga sp. YIM B02566]|uniref:Lrp/AsnC family transcriptional regulator n=1 Tax=Taklimakanibacter albus TaxID=2800327 RepID=A0ACC5R3Y5_9HYPH|nr:Lrp/AsnC family transcriptional regulator [Aestuariivirga sp. YIM B02566]MBK1867359.1 Lrp/AsnC family transcriptional regulator [Aestuariivirga sp. YIM B02566]
MTVTGQLDAIDWRILKTLQDNGRITNVELAEKVGLSPPPCLRRVRALEEAGYIAGYRAMLNAEKLGFEIMVFAMVGLKSQAETELSSFIERVKAWPLVRECYAVSGEADFMLKCVGANLHAMQDFIIKDLTAAANVDSVKTTLILRREKYEPGIPIP